jgi:hypothetical protein
VSRHEPLIGRDPELRRLTAALEGALAGSGRLVRIVGEPGIGKTRLASEAAEVAAARGARVAWGRCWESGGAPAFWPWTQVVRELGADDAPFTAQAACSTAEAEQERFRLFDSMARLLTEASRTDPLVLIMDDAHAADIPSLLFLRFVAKTLRSSRILVLVTHREVEARARPEIGDLLGKITRDGETVFPGRLEQTDIAAWLKDVGRAESEAAAVYRATEGNPLFVRELRELPRERGWDVAGSDAVRAAITEHLARVSSAARRTLEVAAILGREAPWADVALLSEAPTDQGAHVREGIALGVIEKRRRDVIAFRHVLLRDELYASIDARRRDVLHARAADMYARRGDLGEEDALAPAAHHELLAAGSAEGVTRAVQRVQRAAARAVKRVAYEEAAALLERAVALLESRGVLEGSRSCELLVDWGEALMLSGSGPRGRDVCARAAALAKVIGESALIVRAALVYGSEILTGRRDERMIALLRDALVAIGPEDSPERARVLGRLSSAILPVPMDITEPTRLATEAIAMARRCGDRSSLLHTMQFAVGAHAFRLPPTERLALVCETLSLALELDKPTIAATVFPWTIAADLELGDAAACEEHMHGLARLVERLPMHYRIRLPLAQATRASLRGSWVEMDEGLLQANALAEASETPLPRFLLAFARQGAHFARRDAAMHERDRASMNEVFKQLTNSAPAYMSFSTALAADLGVIDRVTAQAEVRSVLGSMWSILNSGVLQAAAPAAYSAIFVGDADLVAELFDGVAVAVENNPVIFLAGCAGSLGPTSLLLGDMAALLGRKDDAVKYYDAAIELSDSIGATLYSERAALHKSKLCAPSGRPPPPSARPAASASASPRIALSQEGEMWTLRAGDDAWNLKPSKGLSYLAMLIAHPHREIHVAQMVGAGEEVTGDAGPLLDEAAKESYRRRATDIREALDEATAHGDVGRVERARAELEALGEELARAVGLGRRDRKAASDVERMRVNVQRRLRDAIERVRAQSPALGRYLDASIRTGSFCSYSPAWTGKDG